MKNRKRKLAVVVAIISAAVGVLGALGSQGGVRTVDAIQLFAGGFGAGIAIGIAVTDAARRRQNIFPALKYRNGSAAIAWLRDAFGFALQTEMPGAKGSIAHAELKLGTGVLMLGSVGTPDPKNPWSTTGGLYVYVKDVDAHHARARKAGVEIVRELHDTSYGAREYSALDLEGQLWSFGTYYPEA